MDPGTFFLDPSSVSVALYDATLGTYLTGGTLSFSSDLSVLSVKPASALTTGHVIYFYVYNGRDLSGNPQSNFYTLGNVGASADTAAPVVLETNPPANLTGVTPNVPIQIEFNKEMDPTSIANLQLLQGSTRVAVTVSFTRLNHVIVLTPNVPLQFSTVYTISINGVKDSTGNTFSGTQLVNFTTGTTIKVNAPSAVTMTPCCSQISVPDNSSDPDRV